MNRSVNIAMAYENIFLMILLEKTPLPEIDLLLTETSDNTVDNWSEPIGKQIQGAEHFYLISSAHTDRLGADELNAMEEFVVNPQDDTYLAAREVVLKTYRKVMCANPDDSEKMTCLGPYPDPKFCFDNDAIVLGIGEYMGERNAYGVKNVISDMKDNLFIDISRDFNVKMILSVM